MVHLWRGYGHHTTNVHHIPRACTSMQPHRLLLESLQPYHCSGYLQLPVFYISTASITVITDFLVLALPIWIFLGLNMRARLKALIMGLFFLGGG